MPVPCPVAEDIGTDTKRDTDCRVDAGRSKGELGQAKEYLDKRVSTQFHRASRQIGTARGQMGAVCGEQGVRHPARLPAVVIPDHPVAVAQEEDKRRMARQGRI